MRSALGFLTVVGGAAPPDRRAPGWFGPVGAVIGLVVGGAWWAAGELWPPLVAAVLAVAVDAALTGMLHLDGLADTADGLLPPLDRQRRLAVMATPGVGAFGVVVVVLVVGLRVAALASLEPDPLLVAGLWAAVRAGMALALAWLPYARPGGGAASGFAAPRGGARPAAPALVALAVAGATVVLAVDAGQGPGLAVVGGAIAAFGGVLALARRRLGGYTGDVLGAAGVVAETVGLLVAAARW
ncbi:MAG TPA: adenosylcobinamide-GDP ribazoletransferase [Acidimicrobiales bacterium]|jgi:adenosylcobinamide-GDP ribazoletransferase|nr:adenosylcobinamide-GDP ribazoletransferase [Acidimicrobiales bacterium]